jgi:hypothetical protein
MQLNRIGGTVVYAPDITLSWSGNNATGTLSDSTKSVQTDTFTLAGGNTYTITISGLDVNASYEGMLYTRQSGLSKRFGIMEVIQQ